MARLTDTQLVILSAASQREDRGVELPANVQGKAAGQVVAKLVRASLLEEIKASGSLPVWRRDNEDGAIALRITNAGLAAIEAADEAMATSEENDSRLGSTGEAARSVRKAISFRKQISVAAQKSARKRHRPGKAKTETRLAPGQPGGLEAGSGAGDAGPSRRSDDCRHHASDPLATAFGARLFRRCGAQEAWARSSLGEG